MEKKLLFAIDLMPILYRGYFVFLKSPRRTTSGINTSPISLLASTFISILDTYKPTHVVLAMESQTPTFRHLLYPEYKAQREKMPEDIMLSIPMAEELAEAMGLSSLHVDGFEADDILGTLAKRGVADGFDVVIASPDKDLGQLAGPSVKIFKPGETTLFDEITICQQWGVSSPDKLLDYLALAGDSSDNIPGVPGVGPKTAVKLLQEWGSFDGVLENAAKIKGKLGEQIQQNRELAILSKKLVTIVQDAPIEKSWDDFAVKDYNLPKLTDFLTKYELVSLAKRLKINLNASAPIVNDLPLFASSIGEDASQEKISEIEEQPVVATVPQYDTLENFPHKYILADSESEIENLILALKESPRFAFDTETTGLNPRKDFMVGCSFSTKPGLAWYLPVPFEDFAGTVKLLERFRSVFEDETKVKIGQNLKFDRGVLRHYGFDLKGELHDTMLAHYLIDATSRHDMDYLSRFYLNYEPIPISTLLGDKKQGNMAEHFPAEIRDYAAEDADVTLRLEDALRPLIEKNNNLKLLEECEEPLVSVLLDMEEEGVKIDTTAIRLFSQELDREILRLEMQIREYTGVGVNLSSPKQIGEVLFEYLKIDPSMKRSPRGQYPTNEEVLLKIRDRHPIVDLILDYRTCLKLKNTYVDKLPKCIDPETGRIHTTFHQAFTETGRLSSSDPNLQNIPVRSDRGQRIRAAFVPRDAEHVLLSADYSQVELRLMAVMSKDEQMLAAFNANLDIHSQTAAKVYKIPLEEVSTQQRSFCKMVNFGIIYGISAFGLSQRLRIPRKDAQMLIDAYFAEYPDVREFMKNMVKSATEKGYAETLFGRRRLLPDLTSRNGTTRQAAERIAINMPVQGTAADIIKMAMVKIAKSLKEKSLKTKMILQIHDELLFDVPRDEIEIVKPLVEDAMKNIVNLPIPLEVSIGIGDNWLDAH